MRNKIIFGSVGAIILVLLIFFMIGKEKPQETATEPETEESKQENEESEQEPEETEEETNEEESAPTTPFQKYKHYGEDCLDIEDTIERGDCFQSVGEEHINWEIDEDKEEFYYPYQPEQERKYVFYKEIGEDDQLSDMVETDYFDDYEDPIPHGNNYERGETAIDEYWHVLSNLVPQENREALKYLYWTDTGDDVVYAVGNKQDEIGSMYLTFSHLVPHRYEPFLRYTLLHEFGHILTLNETQVELNKEVIQNLDISGEKLEQIKDSCDTVYVYGGCVKEDSYINAYYEQFWSDIDERHEEIDWEDEHEYEEFFFDYEERFFNSYQGVALQEDIADMFVFFLYSHSNVTEKREMKYEKINFFYEYDELVELRTNILENLYNFSVEEGKFF